MPGLLHIVYIEIHSLFKALPLDYETVPKLGHLLLLGKDAGLEGKYDIAICDFHAEATSEKQVFAHRFDGRIKIIFGTHTHVPTADERLTELGGAFITDIGMCGGEDSVIGLTYSSVESRYMQNIRRKGVADAKNVALNGAVFTVNESTLCVTEVKRIKYTEGDLL